MGMPAGMPPGLPPGVIIRALNHYATLNRSRKTLDSPRDHRHRDLPACCFAVLRCGLFCIISRAEYVQLVADAKALKLKVETYQGRAEVVKRMMADYHLDPAKLSRETIVGEASSAIQKAAAGSGYSSPVRESASRGNGDEIAIHAI